MFTPERFPNETTQTVRISLRLDAPIHAALRKEGKTKQREVGEHIQRVLAEYAIHQGLIDEPTVTGYQAMWKLIDRAINFANETLKVGNFTTDITLKTFQRCMKDQEWAAAYENYIGDNPYKHGNPRKSPINKEIGFRIREAVGGKVVKLSNGKPAKVPVSGEIIQSYTPMEVFHTTSA